MSITKHSHAPFPATAARSGRRLLLLAMLVAPLARTHAAGIRIVHSEVSAADPTGTLRKILVLGWGARQDLRQLFEYDLALALRGLGVQADASHRRLNAGEVPRRDAVTRVVRAEGFDGVLVARLIATERAATASSTARGEDVEPTLERNLARLETPAEPAQDGLIAVTETSLYRVADGARVWSALTDVQDPKDLVQTSRDYASVVVAELRRHRLV